MALPNAFTENEMTAELDPGVAAAMGQRTPFENSYDNAVLNGEEKVQETSTTTESGEVLYDPPEYQIGPQDFAGEMVIPEAAADDNITPDVAGDEIEDDTDDEEWPEYLLNEAGLTADQAAEYFADKSALAALVTAQDQQYIEQGKLAAAQSPVEQAAQAADDDDLPEFQLPPPADGNEWGEDIEAVFKQMDTRFRDALKTRDQKLKAIEESYQKQREDLQRQQQMQQIADFDHYIDDLGNEFAGLFGRGSGMELPQQSLAFRNRARLYRTAEALQQGLIADGRSRLSNEEAWTRALMATFPLETIQQVRQTATQEAQAQSNTRQRLVTARPTARRQPTKPLTQQEREQRAAANAEKFYQERGFAALTGDYDTQMATV